MKNDQGRNRQRDVVRLGVVSIPVTFSVSAKWLKLLTGFKQQDKISVDYFDTQMLAAKITALRRMEIKNPYAFFFL